MLLMTLLRRRPWVSAATAAGVLVVAALAVSRQGAVADASMTAVVTRGTLSPRLTTAGTLHPIQSITYRSPLGGREAEVVFLVAEGTRVIEGDLLVRIDTTDLQQELERTAQELRQAQVDLRVAEIDRQQSQATLESLSSGEGAVSVAEAQARRQLAERKVERLTEELIGLEPLMVKGFITREEYRRTADALEQAEEELAMARRREDVLVDVTRPQERQRAELLRAQAEAQFENVNARLREVEARRQRLADQIEACQIYARRPGLVVHEEYLSANPRRKIRVGDRVTGTQGIVTIPDVDRMTVATSVSEADVHRIRPGLNAEVRLEAFPGLTLTGQVTAIGALARSAADRPFDDKRFDVEIALEATEADIRPEMTARADIVLDARPMALLVPVNAVFEQRGELVCHVIRGSGTETRAVLLGETDGHLVEVLSGLEEGTRVSLASLDQPTASTATPGAGTAEGASGVKRGRR